MRTNYVLIDLENVRPELPALGDCENVRLIVFVGAGQSRLPYEVVAGLQPLGPRAEYIQIAGNGPNALDFHIAYYVGRLASADPSAYFHIVSNDKGFDPLVRHLRAQKILADRVGKVADILSLNAKNANTVEERLDVVLARLRRMGPARPRTVATVSGTIRALFDKRLSEDEVSALVALLQARGHVTVVGGKLCYATAEAG